MASSPASLANGGFDTPRSLPGHGTEMSIGYYSIDRHNPALMQFLAQRHSSCPSREVKKHSPVEIGNTMQQINSCLENSNVRNIIGIPDTRRQDFGMRLSINSSRSPILTQWLATLEPSIVGPFICNGRNVQQLALFSHS